MNTFFTISVFLIFGLLTSYGIMLRNALKKKDKETLSDKSRIYNAVDLILNYGGIDGSHHKQWVLDQVVRSLTTEQGYQDFLSDYRGDPEDDEHYYGEWDKGIAP